MRFAAKQRTEELPGHLGVSMTFKGQHDILTKSLSVDFSMTADQKCTMLGIFYRFFIFTEGRTSYH